MLVSLPGQTDVFVVSLHAGNLRTSDSGGPYNFTLLPVQVNEVKGVRPLFFLLFR